jgi:hypothetical protein
MNRPSFLIPVLSRFLVIGYPATIPLPDLSLTAYSFHHPGEQNGLLPQLPAHQEQAMQSGLR